MAVNKVIFYGEVLVDMSQVTVSPATLVEGETAMDASGELITGQMPDNGAVTATIDGVNTASYAIPAGKHDGSGAVSFDDSAIVAMLDAI